MNFREATSGDIPQIQIVRNSVKENVLSNPALVTNEGCDDFINVRGKGWVCEIDNEIVGFVIADLQDDNIWALFLNPDHEGKGIGTQLHRMMLDWYFSTGKQYVWLGTSPDTKAEKFYRRRGWTQNGLHGKNEIKFEMSREQWEDLRRK
jgi:GNAT superfamily N-acetyltransferase